MKPEYVAVRSALYNFNFLICLVLLILGVIPGVIYIIYKLVLAKHCIVEFYSDKYIMKSGVFNTREDEVVFKGVLSIVCSQTLVGKILGYGTVKADVAGKSNIYLVGVKKPGDLKDYLQKRKIDADSVNHAIIN